MARFTALWGSSAARISQLRAIIRARAVPLSQWVRRLALALLCLALLRFDVPPYGDRAASLDRLIGAHQFDLLRWWVRAALAKARAEALAAHWHMSEEDQIALVQEYVQQLGTLDAVNAQIEALYADPLISDPHAASATLRARRDALRAWLSAHQSLVESILQDQVESVLREEGFAVGGQTLPPVRFRFTELPEVMVISRRDRIERIDGRTLTPGIPLEEKDRLEREVSRRFNVSALVVRIGGLAAYPVMLPQTTALDWLLEVLAHKWAHNYLAMTLSWVGLNILSDPHALIINETTASIVGREIGPRVMARYYPQLSAALASDVRPHPHVEEASEKFDFRREMRATRLRVDALLAEGKIEEAEAYMEARRRVFVANGYPIRKLNQAYFAFYGAYNDEPGGAPAAGDDPIGPAVQRLRAQSASLGDFLRAVASLRSLEDLYARVGAPR
ncbi:MAG: hypothetical protein N2545_08575 [Thermoflexales bacterium]|nr:hypothetical protein [Thermoflexales bacterium]